jgi:hypothetical protein
MRVYLDEPIKSFEDYTTTYRELATLKARATDTNITVDDRTLKQCIQKHSPFIIQAVENECTIRLMTDSINSS